MARRMQPPKPSLPPIPSALRELLNAEGRYRFNSFVQNPDGTIRHDGRWESYKNLKRQWCAAAGIPTRQFAAAARAASHRRR